MHSHSTPFIEASDEGLRNNRLYRMIHEEQSIFRETIVSAIVGKKFT